ncbi:cytochrome P450 76A1-like [Mangifera indica]|uniref:cytochrome P450 76A1-like n=1 Tax=Mangifera indica TaxID=29780 RepID=UPI001CFB8224|nr:cytochrome P450 76A1-like [Mangifera indica]
MSPVSFIVFVIIILSSTLLLRRRKSRRGQLPPGPPGWPIVGNMFQLGSMPHRTLNDLRDKYGEVIWLNFGAKDTMVLLSAKAATDFFKNHDLSFADRNIIEIMRAHDYYRSSLALAPYGSFWRLLRRLVTIDMLVNKRINETVSIRRKCVNDMLIWIEKEASQGNGEGRRSIHVARFVFLSSFNLLGNLMLSRDLLDPNSKDAAEFFASMIGLMEWGGHPNISDFFPFLRWLDPQGLKRKMKRDLGKAMKIASKFVKERVEEMKEGDRVRKDFLDVLLEFEGNGKDEPAKLSDEQLNIFILEIFLAGSETTSSSIEWALTELLCKPESLNRVKAELAEVVGPNRKLEESDIENLPYLQAVIKENLRLHPPIPFLIPRRAMEDTNFNGYHIPKNTQVLINAWAIGRDPDVWSEPLSFKPERFLGSKVDYKGQNYELIPFGAGRRMCAGVPLAHRMLNLLLGSLLHEFDWELDCCKETMDMTDRLGITMRKSEPLYALPKSKRCI